MNPFTTGCGKFRVLSSDLLDRTLRPSEEAFLMRHRERCESCRTIEANQHLALNMLRSTAIHEEPTDGFDRRVLRRARIQSVREGFGYWSPAAVGATIAAVLVLALLNIVGRPGGLRENTTPVGEARRTTTVPAIPDFTPGHSSVE